MTRELWLEAHSYLRPLGDLSAQVDRAADGIAVLDARIPDWDDYRRDFLAGVPLLSSADAAVDLEPGGRMAAALLERLASETSPDWLAAETRALDTELRRDANVSGRLADFLLGDETLTPPFAGLLRYLAWTAMARFLRPVVNAFEGWRDEDRWLRRYCPTCGSLPAMAQLAAPIPGASVCSRAAVAARVGSSSEPDAHFVKPTVSGWRVWPPRENTACASTTVRPAAATSRHMMGRATRLSCCRTGRHCTST